jgi:hypothetical protein
MKITLARVPLQPGQQFLLGVDHEGRREWHDGKILSRDGIQMRIECAPESDLALQSAPGTEIILDTWRLMDARYVLRARVLAVLPHEHPQVDVELIEGTRVQHREYFRVPISLEPCHAWVESRQPDVPDRQVRLHLREISAAGLRARSSELLSVTSVLRIDCTLPGSRVPLALRARVMRVLDEPVPFVWPCEVGAAFIDLSTRDREEIIRFALRLQAEDIRQGVM